MPATHRLFEAPPSGGGAPFRSVLVANRGEIAVRIARTLRRLGIRSVAVHSDADVGALHVRESDQAVAIGGTAPADSYLRIDRIVDAALASGAEAVHPGYGFLAENAALARACQAAGLVFVGPPAEAIDAMGDKIRARHTVAAAGVPVVPGTTGAETTDDELVAAAEHVGFPVMVKPSAGGGGKGMLVVDAPGDLPGALQSARRTAVAAFGDGTLLIERFLRSPRHIEVQVLCDAHGGAVHLGERECSLQRRHQKVVEEAPSPFLDDELRAEYGRLALAVARACGFVGAGTVELIVAGDRPDQPYFMEMNTRLQVEHPVTELVWEVDLVEAQLRIAAGERLGARQGDLVPRGHAVEARVYAEDPGEGFLPSAGPLHVWREPRREGIRVDSGVTTGDVVHTAYDPLLAKVVARGPDRAAALGRLRGALHDTVAVGVATNVAFLVALLDHPDVRSGRLDTGLIERHAGDLVPEPPAAAVVAAALAQLEGPAPADPWDDRGGWRVGGPAAVRWQAVGPAGPVVVTTRRDAEQVEVQLDGGPVMAACSVRDGDGLVVSLDGLASRWTVWRRGLATWVVGAGGAWRFDALAPRPYGGATTEGAAEVRSPMPGTVLQVVDAGIEVLEGSPVAVVEAMKMEHVLRAPHDGVVTTVAVTAGDRVDRGEVVAVVEAAAPPKDVDR